MGSNSNDNLDVHLYKSLFCIISKEYFKYTDKLLKNTDVRTYNLKNSLDRCFCKENKEIDFDFLKYVREFNSDLNLFQFNLITKIQDRHSVKITSRVKDENSIIAKLYKWKVQDNKGKYQIKKCLNDLLGIRIIDANYKENIKEIDKYINNENKKEKIKARGIFRNIEQYQGYHVYISGKDKTCFPMEIQIWDKQYEASNLKSHSLYKKDYTMWSRKYYE